MTRFTKHSFIAFKKIFFRILILSLIFSPVGLSEENPQDPAKPENVKPALSPVNKTLVYYIDNQSLIENIKYDTFINESKTETISNGELLILKHLSKNNKKRGNVLFLHTDGESANHHRIVRPLSIQLSRLGWNVYIPNIAKEDFKKPKFGTERKIYPVTTKNDSAEVNSKPAANNEEKTQAEPAETPDENATVENLENKSSSEATQPSYLFDSPEQYQTYINEICEKVFADANWANQPRILVLNQTSSYWGLSCLSNINMPTIFLDPQLPLGATNNLEETFSTLSSSFYVFYSQLTANTNMASFSKALSSNQWRSKNQRYSQGILPKGKLNIEDIALAKRITGWTEKLRKQP